MVDIATRVWNHKWKIDPIVRSLIDTDFYKLLMCQSVFRNRPDTTVTFSLINRTDTHPAGQPHRRGRTARTARPHPLPLASPAAKAPGCAATPSTASARCSPPNSWTGSRICASRPTSSNAVGDQYELTFEGKWPEVMMWEIPALAVLMELRGRAVLRDMGRFELQVLYARAMTKLWEKIERSVPTIPRASPISAPAAAIPSSGRTGACRP